MSLGRKQIDISNDPSASFITTQQTLAFNILAKLAEHLHDFFNSESQSSHLKQILRFRCKKELIILI